MIDSLSILLLSALVLMGSPGPATLSLAALGSAFGIRTSLRYLGGIICGTATVLAVVASGITGVLFAVPGALPVVTVAAAAYILYLAWKIATAPPVRQGEAGQAPSFPGGYFLAIANPKAYAAIGAVYSGTVVIEGQVGLDAAVKLVALTIVIIVVNSSWLVFGSAFSAVLSSPHLSRAVNIGFAVLLVASVLASLLL